MEYIQTIGTALGTITITQVRGVIEVITALGDMDTVLGDTDTTLGIMVDTMEDITEDTTAAFTTLGITDMTHGTTEDGIVDTMILGIMATQDSMTHSTTTCTHTTADGTADGILTTTAYISDRLTVDIT